MGGEQSPSSVSPGHRTPSPAPAARAEAYSEDSGVGGAVGAAPDGSGFSFARPRLPRFVEAFPMSTFSPGSLGDTGKAGGGRTRHGRRARAMKGLQGNGKGRGSPRGPGGGGSSTAGPGPRPLLGPRVPARRFRLPPGPPRAVRATSSSDVSRRRHIGKAPPPPPPPLLPQPLPPLPPPSSSCCLTSAATKKIEPLVRPTDAGSTRSPSARLLMTAPGPAADGPLPSARS